MVGSSRIDIHHLNLDELVGVVNLYPWYGGARLELCRRMARMGDAWDEEQYAPEALYLPQRSILVNLLKRSRQADYSDKDIQALLASYLEPSAPESEATEEAQHTVHVVGGDYFSQAQYDNVKKGSDNIFSRFAVQIRSEATPAEDGISPVADRFATETLARIFAEQGRPEEAKRIYSRLILDIPEKSAYFASLIDSLESETSL
ncbi:MAG: hypothetical protein J5646_06085 [Bacteroidales bacterium]|nr:hypothetical protein [Bacteroidales bacterium]MBR4740078.1 hypothetical protein [Bacteroidales bacterium]